MFYSLWKIENFKLSSLQQVYPSNYSFTTNADVIHHSMFVLFSPLSRTVSTKLLVDVKRDEPCNERFLFDLLLQNVSVIKSVPSGGSSRLSSLNVRASKRTREPLPVSPATTLMLWSWGKRIAFRRPSPDTWGCKLCTGKSESFTTFKKNRMKKRGTSDSGKREKIEE